jgi:hypothetical protein
MRRKCLINYHKKILYPVERVKKHKIEIFDARADFKHVSVLQTFDRKEINQLFIDEFKPETL